MRSSIRRRGRVALAASLLLPLLCGTGITTAAASTVATQAVTDRVALATPAAGATVTDVVLRWLPVSGATEYELQVSPNGDWANNVSFSVTVKGVQYSPPVTLGNASYFWRARASAGTVKGPWSEERLFNRVWTPTPELTSPTNGSVDVEIPTFRWTPVSGASRYELNVGRDVNFSPGTYQSCTTDHTTFTPYTSVVPLQFGCNVDPAPGVTLYWRVRGLDDPGNVFGQWSQTSSFLHRKPVPVVTGPANGASTSAPVLTWDPVGDSEQYVVNIIRRDGFPIETRTTWATSYSPLVALKPSDGPFTWYVQTKERNGSLGLVPPRSDWRTFNVTAAPTTAGASPEPLSVTPVAGTSRAPALAWAPVKGAASYTVNYLSGGVYRPLQTKVPFPVLTDPDKAEASGDFAWFVEAFGPTGAYISRGAESTYRIAPNPLPTYTAPCAVGEVCQNQRSTPTLRWKSVEQAGYYRVYLALDRSFTNIVKEYVTQYTELTPRQSLLDNQAGQSYYWFARACSGDLCGPFGAAEHPSAATFRKQTNKVTGLKVRVEPSTTSLTWDDYLTARQYRVQVSASPDFSPLLDEMSVDQTTYAAFARSYPAGRPLYARVQAIDGSTNLLTASDTLTFQVGAGGGVVGPRVTALTPAVPSATSPWTITFSETVLGVSPSTVQLRLGSAAVPGSVRQTGPRTATFTPTAPLVPGETYTLVTTSGITTTAGARAAAFSRAVRVSTNVDDASPALRQSWDLDATTQASGGLVATSATAGASISVSAGGTSAAVYGVRSADGGFAEVLLDGVRQGTVSLYGSGRALLWNRSGLTNTPHTVTVRVLGTKQAGSAGTWVRIDGFGVGAGRFEESHAAVRMRGASIGSPASLGGSATRLDQVASGDDGRQASYSMAFKGTGITWAGARGPWGGKAAVYVDDVLRGTVDTYAATATGRAAIWSSPTLSNSRHTVKIVVLGTKRVGATGTAVSVDSLSVR